MVKNYYTIKLITTSIKITQQLRPIIIVIFVHMNKLLLFILSLNQLPNLCSVPFINETIYYSQVMID